MKKFFFIVLCLLITCAWSEEEMSLTLDEPNVNLFNIASIKRGAKFFATNCMICHTMVYMRYNNLAKEAGVLYERMPLNIKAWPFNIKPPDLSLEANIRGTAWIYTYLHSFYSDPARPTGYNNLLMPNTAMPGILAPFQGKQVLASDLPTSRTIYLPDYHWYDFLVLENQGMMSPQQFDETMNDVINFLAYAANPYQASQQISGIFVIAFLLVFFILAYLLKKSYWRNLGK